MKMSMMENNIIRFLEKEDYYCRILEEILIFNEREQKLLGSVTVIERAEKDLKDLIKYWQLD